MEEIVNFEVAKKLKETGFRKKCLYRYHTYSKTPHINEVNPKLARKIDYSEFFKCYNLYVDSDIDAPTIEQVLEWLRKEKELYIEIYMYHNCYLWEIYNTKIYDADFTQKSEKYSEIEYETYEQAALAGIEYVLDNLI